MYSPETASWFPLEDPPTFTASRPSASNSFSKEGQQGTALLRGAPLGHYARWSPKPTGRGRDPAGPPAPLAPGLQPCLTFPLHRGHLGAARPFWCPGGGGGERGERGYLEPPRHRSGAGRWPPRLAPLRLGLPGQHGRGGHGARWAPAALIRAAAAAR